MNDALMELDPAETAKIIKTPTNAPPFVSASMLAQPVTELRPDMWKRNGDLRSVGID